MTCSNSPGSSDSDVDITDYDSDATEVQCWELVGSANLRETDGSYVAALELAIHSLQTRGDPEDGTLQAGPQEALFRSSPREAVLVTSDAVQPFRGPHEATVPPEAGHFFQTGRQTTFDTAHTVPPFHTKNEEGPSARNVRYPSQTADQEAPSAQEAAHPFQNDDEATPVQATARTPFQTCRKEARAPPEADCPFQTEVQEAPTAYDTTYLFHTDREGAPSLEADYDFCAVDQKATAAYKASRPFQAGNEEATSLAVPHGVHQSGPQEATATATAHAVCHFQAEDQEIPAPPEAGHDTVHPLESNREATPAQDTARHPFQGDPTHTVVDGPWIWERVQQALGQNTPLRKVWKARPSGIPHFSLPGSGPWPCAVVVCTRFSSMNRDFSKQSWLDEVQRCRDASQTFLRFQAVISPAIVFPWVRVQSSTERFAFGPHEATAGIRRTWTHVTNPSLRLRELQHFLRALPPGLNVWFLSIGIDGFTTELSNLSQLRQWYPFLRFHLAVMERHGFPRFLNGLVNRLNGVDLCPARPGVGGMRIRVFSFDLLLDAQPTGVNCELCVLWRVITDAKINHKKWLFGFTSGRNRFPVVPGGQEHYGRM